MPHIVVLFLHTFCEQIHFQPFLPPEYSGCTRESVVGCSESQFISSKMKPLKMNFFITFFFSLCTGPGLRSLKLNLYAHWQLNHFDSLHTKQESKLTLVFPRSISGSTTENTIKCGNVSTGENLRKVHETKVSEISSPYQNSRH